MGAAGQNRADLAGGGEQGRGLGADDGEIGVLGRLGVLGGGKLHHLALGDHRGGARQHLETGQRADLDHHLERLAEQEVADQHARLVAPQHPRRRLAAPHVAFVDHVVVQERRGVHEFDRGGELDVARSGVAAQPGGRERQDRPQPLAAGRNEMVGDLRDHRDVRSGARQDGLVHPLHVVGDERRQRLDQAIGRSFFERNDNSHETLSLARPRHSTIKTPKRRGKCAPRGSPLVEILRTNDLVLISVIESLLRAAGVGFFVADQHMAAVEGSLGFLPRRILVDAREEARARRLLTEAGLAAELRDG